jgi:hypothetical protein
LKTVGIAEKMSATGERMCGTGGKIGETGERM